MILKTMRKRKYDLEVNSTEKTEKYEVTYISDIKEINRVFDYNGLSTDVVLVFNDNSTLTLALSVKEDNAEKMLYDNVFLLNDKGENIERLV